MIDDWSEGDADFDESFFASLEASPDEPQAPVDDDPLGLMLDEASDHDASLDLADGDAFLYEVEGDGSFETEAADFDSADLDSADFDGADFDPADFDGADSGDPVGGEDYGLDGD